MRLRAVVVLCALLSSFLFVVPGAGALCTPLDCPPPQAPCFGDGVSGDRVQVFYLYTDDANAGVTSVEREILNAMADEFKHLTGRDIRFVCSAGEVDIVPLKVASGDAYEAFLYAVPARYHLETRKLLGIGSNGSVLHPERWLPRGAGTGDERPDPNLNTNNIGPQFAVCSSEGQVCLHELTHAFGAVNSGAPHSTRAGHCWDDNADVMCRVGDGGDGSPGQLGDACPDNSGPVYDCNGDDYFSLHPPAGSYLAEHWNLACSFWIEPFSCPNGSRPADRPVNPYLDD